MVLEMGAWHPHLARAFVLYQLMERQKGNEVQAVVAHTYNPSY
jgi:hypothetical protein